MQSLEEVQGVLGQEMQGLKAERSKFKDLLHDAKWTAAQAAGPDQASVIFCPLLPLPLCTVWPVS
jgi:hypothetical protein